MSVLLLPMGETGSLKVPRIEALSDTIAPPPASRLFLSDIEVAPSHSDLVIAFKGFGKLLMSRSGASTSLVNSYLLVTTLGGVEASVAVRVTVQSPSFRASKFPLVRVHV